MTKQEALEWLTDLTESYTIMGSGEAAIAIAIDCIQESISREPKKPRSIERWSRNGHWWYCGECGVQIKTTAVYCWKCGRRIEWPK